MSSDTPKQVLCIACKEWYDARASECYLCGEKRPEQNNALMTARLNGALATQVSHANADARAESQFRTARNTRNADLANRPLNNYPGYSNLVSSIKSQLRDGGVGE